MAITQTTLGSLLKNVYSKGAITVLQNLEVPFMEYMPDATDFSLGGNGFYFPVNASGDEGYGYIKESAAIPPPQNEVVKQAAVTPVIFAGAVRVTGLAKAIASRDPMSFASALQYHLDTKLRRMTAYQEGALFRSGTGKLCTNPAISAADTTTTGLAMDSVQWLRPNMLLDVRTGTVHTYSNVKVTDVDWAANTAKFDTNMDTGAHLAASHEFYLAGTQQAAVATANNEILGLGAALATSGTYLGIDRAAVTTFKSNVVAAGSTDLDEDLLLLAENRALIVGGISQSNISNFRMVIHPNQRRKYFALVVPQKQFTGLSLDAGYSKLTWNGHEMVESYNCPETSVFMGDFSTFQKFTAPEGDMKIDDTFGPPIKWAQGFDSGIAYWRSYCNYAVRKPNAWVAITGLGNVTNR